VDCRRRLGGRAMIRVTDPLVIVPELLSPQDYRRKMDFVRRVIGGDTADRLAGHIAALEEHAEKLEQAQARHLRTRRDRQESADDQRDCGDADAWDNPAQAARR